MSDPVTLKDPGFSAHEDFELGAAKAHGKLQLISAPFRVKSYCRVKGDSGFGLSASQDVVWVLSCGMYYFLLSLGN